MDVTNFSFLVPTFILAAGIVDDLRSRKVHNKLVLVLMAIGLTATYLQWGLHGLAFGLLAAFVALAICFPLVVTGIMGAGDMKLLMAFGAASSWNTVIWVLIYSFFWGALLGVFQSILRGEGRLLIASTWSVVLLQKKSQFPLHKIPYTVALFFGWLTLLTARQAGGLF